MTKVGLLSDTHGYWDEKYLQYFEPCDEIWHAGDIGTLEVAQKLAAFRPFRAVYGNIDGQDLRRLYPQVLRFTVDGAEDETHRRLSRQIRSVHTGKHPGASAQAVHQRSFAYIEGEVRQDTGHASYKPRRSGHLRLS
jgi:predicted phosphodiesterase